MDLLGEIEIVVRLASKTARIMSPECDTGGRLSFAACTPVCSKNAPSSLAGDGPRADEQLHTSRHQASWLIVQAS